MRRCKSDRRSKESKKSVDEHSEFVYERFGARVANERREKLRLLCCVVYYRGAESLILYPRHADPIRLDFHLKALELVVTRLGHEEDANVKPAVCWNIDGDQAVLQEFAIPFSDNVNGN